MSAVDHHHHRYRVRTKVPFSNPPGTPPRMRRRGKILKFLWRQRIHAVTPEIPHDHILPLDDALRGLDEHLRQDSESLTWLGHASFIVRMAGKTFLLDPFLTEYASPIHGLGPKRFSRPGIPVSKLPPIDAVLVSHNHYDHLDLRTLAALPNKEKIEVVVPLGLGQYFDGIGYRHVSELNWHDGTSVGDLRVTCVPAIHRSARTLTDRNLTLWGGFVIESADHKIFFGGDTGYGPVFKETGRRYGPFDLAIIGIGAYAPRAAMHMNHADPEEAVQMALHLRATNVLAMHWGTIIMTEEPPFEPPERFRIAAAKAGFSPEHAWLMRIGETRAMPNCAARSRAKAA